jgi:hypothetical protein
MNESFDRNIIVGAILNLIAIGRASQNKEGEKDKISFCLLVLDIMNKYYDSWQEICPYNHEMIGKDFYNALTIINDDKIFFVNDFFIYCLRFAIEISFYKERFNEIDSDVEEIQSKIRKINLPNTDDFSYVISDAFKIDILNFYIGKQDSQAFLNYKEHLEKARESFEELLREINNAEEEASRIAKILEEQKITGTFVELEKGFSLMLDRVKKAKNWTFGWLLAISAIIIAIPTVRIFYPMTISDASIWEKLVPLIGVELILIYFFRVTLKHYYSLQTQIMQLDFRYSLCQFIGAYSEYSRKIKAANGSALDKFESLIFSNLLSESDNIPSTFDGLDNLASLINNMRGK